jgi:hypothetical protein
VSACQERATFGQDECFAWPARRLLVERRLCVRRHSRLLVCHVVLTGPSRVNHRLVGYAAKAAAARACGPGTRCRPAAADFSDAGWQARTRLSLRAVRRWQTGRNDGSGGRGRSMQQVGSHRQAPRLAADSECGGVTSRPRPPQPVRAVAARRRVRQRHSLCQRPVREPFPIAGCELAQLDRPQAAALLQIAGHAHATGLRCLFP